MKHTVFLLARWVAALGFMISAYVVGQRTTAVEDAGYGAVMPLLYGMGLLIAGVLCIGTELMHWGSIPIRMLFENLLYPSDSQRPPPDYTLTRLYCEQERYGEALEQYQQILRYHPQELLAYVEAITLAFEVGEEATANKIYRKALMRLRAPQAREQVRRTFAECKERAENPEPPAEEGEEEPSETPGRGGEE